MSFRVRLTDDATRDLDDIIGYVRRRDTPGKARDLLVRIQQTLQSLAEQPNRGSYPDELAALGIKKYRQVRFKPYRIIYHVREDAVLVLVVADGRRDMRTLLQRRLLEA